MRSLPFIGALVALTAPTSFGERVWFGDTGSEVSIEEDYDAHNIFVVNGTTLSLRGGSITAPDTGDDGEDAVRVEDATFNAINGTISGGLGVGGSAVTVSTTRDSGYPPGTATFSGGVELYGGDATRERTSRGGDALQVLQAGSLVTIDGGKFTPGTGCSSKVCGKATDNGVALQVIEGKAIVKGGMFEGNFYNFGGDIEVHGCVKYDKEAGTITGVMLDGSEIDVVYTQPAGQDRRPTIVDYPDLCKTPSSDPAPSSSGHKAHAISLSMTVLCVMYVACSFK